MFKKFICYYTNKKTEIIYAEKMFARVGLIEFVDENERTVAVVSSHNVYSVVMDIVDQALIEEKR